MSKLIRRSPFEITEPIRQFLEGEQLNWLRVEEYQDGDTMVVRAELPGVDPDKDVEITVAGDMLTINAKREERTEHEGWQRYRSEFRYGSFTRSFQLPEGTREKDIRASYRDGVLEIRIPAPRQSRPPARKIEIERDDAPPEDAGPVAGVNF